MNRINAGQSLKILAILLTAGLFSITASAQNAMPVVSNVVATVNTGMSNVSIDFDATDMEGNDLDIWMQVSADSGKTWRVPVSNLTGDFGFPVTPGTGKNITWNYDAGALANWLGSAGGNMGFRIRVVADDRIQIDINDIVAMVDSARIMQNLAFVEGPRHRTAALPHLLEVRDSLKALMAAQQLFPWHDAWTYQGYAAENIISRKAGLKNEEKTCGISGHYDSVSNTPGVDDNGSGMAGVMEAIHVLGDFFTENSIKYYFWDLEEVNLNGSVRYVNSQMPDWQELEGLLNMETMGYYSDQVNSQSLPAGFEFLFPAATDSVEADSNRGNFLTNVANSGSSSALKALFDSCAAVYVPDLRVITLETPGNGTITPDLLRSDHAPFWLAGLPALMLTDGADFRNNNYHTPGDSLATVDPQFMFRNVKAVVATLATMAKPMHADAGESNDFVLSIPVGLSTPEVVNGLNIYPNPGDEHFTFALDLSQASDLSIRIYDLEGREIRQIASGAYGAGHHEWTWNAASSNGTHVSHGMYLLRVDSDTGSQTKRLLVGKFEHKH